MNPLQLLSTFQDDLKLYAENCLRIKDKAGNEVPLVFDRKQDKLTRKILDLSKIGRADVMIVKARQIYVSTGIEALIHQQTTTKSGKTAMIVGPDFDTSQNLFAMQQFFFLHNPIKPMVKTMNRSMIYYANPDPSDAANPGLHSQVISETAENQNIGRSFRIHIAHLSEFNFYERVCDVPKMLLALNQAVPRLPGCMKIIESTAGGEGIFKRMWEDPTNGYEKIFASWVSHQEYRLPIPPGMRFPLSDVSQSEFGNEIEEMAAIAKELNYWYPEFSGNELEDQIWSRLAWRRKKIHDDCNGDVNSFKAEYPTTTADAFAAGGTGVFNQWILSEITQQLSSAGLQPARYHFNLRAFDDGKDWHSFHNAFRESSFGSLCVYRNPEKDRRYVIGADPSYGINDKDPSAVVILSLPDLEEVAVWNAPITPDKFGELLFALGKFYNYAFIGVETNSVGQETQRRLSKLHYHNVYRRRKMNLKPFTEFTAEYGWSTDGKSKHLMVVDARGAIGHQEVLLNHRETVRQLRAYQESPNGELEAPEGDHDDLVMAFMIAIQMARNIHLSTHQKVSTQPGSFDWYIEQSEKIRGKMPWDTDPIRMN